MKKSESIAWEEKQKYLFELIKARIQKHQSLSGVIEEVLNISADSAYRRIKCMKYLTAIELYVLCRKFNISMDEILNYTFGQNKSFKYSVIAPASNENYIQYLQQLYEMTTMLSVDKSEFFLTASDIPFYYFHKYPELLCFKLYNRNSILNSSHISYTNFCEQLNKNALMSFYEQVSEAYLQIQSTEIWSVHTISGILQSLKYCATTKCFENRETWSLLLRQLSELISTVENEADNGKRINEQTPFHLHISPIDITDNILLIRNDNKYNCYVRLFAATNFYTNDADFCSDIRREITDLTSMSALVSARLKHERRQFFQNMRDKINDVTDYICNNVDY